MRRAFRGRAQVTEEWPLHAGRCGGGLQSCWEPRQDAWRWGSGWAVSWVVGRKPCVGPELPQRSQSVVQEALVRWAGNKQGLAPSWGLTCVSWSFAASCCLLLFVPVCPATSGPQCPKR